MRGEENCRSPHPTGVRKTPGISCSVAMRRSWPCVGSASCNVYVYAVIPGIPVGLGCGRAGRSPAVRVTRTRIAQYRRRAGRGGLAGGQGVCTRAGYEVPGTGQGAGPAIDARRWPQVLCVCACARRRGHNPRTSVCFGTPSATCIHCHLHLLARSCISPLGAQTLTHP